ncbi:YhcN/YlaJ family sporulation lipoprotein [Virgibacillus sp.]|uniref:YhcN/YlaJ family sporulation lipoprotein n=1 Tax=Virgibacillus sp. TaxID=1872700 RepID=UPI0017937571|nr:YhcN/YlaJ family sporulation lipoprotein [Virgibacillus sp.]NWO13295.1 YhcN/YlaJ family sporulation lipoprotein [Virgibacillus sp.]
MRFKINIILLSLAFIVLGCTNEEAEYDYQHHEKDNTQPIHYETDKERKDRLNIREETVGEKGGYPQSKQDNINRSDFKSGYADPFTNEESKLIAEALRDHKQISQAQVASTADRILIGVKLNTHVTDDVGEDIKKEVKQLLPQANKEIIIYTDDAHWEKMKNLEARIEAKDNGKKMEEFINQFVK